PRERGDDAALGRVLHLDPEGAAPVIAHRAVGGDVLRPRREAADAHEPADPVRARDRPDADQLLVGHAQGSPAAPPPGRARRGVSPRVQAALARNRPGRARPCREWQAYACACASPPASASAWRAAMRSCALALGLAFCGLLRWIAGRMPALARNLAT